MSTIQFPGLFTGIDTSELINQLMQIERRRLEAYEAKKSTWDERQDALSTLQTKLSTLRSTTRAISDAGELRAFSTTSSDSDILTAEASYNAFEGNHTVVINQLATAERWVHTNGIEYVEDYVGEGTFIYSYNNKESVITTTATTTLEDLVGLINNDANNPGVTAGLLYYNDAYHLVLNGNDAGTDYEISINTSNTEVWQADSAFTVDSDNATLGTKITDIDDFEYNGGALVGDERIHITGHEHDGTAVNVYMDVTSNTKLFHVIEEINDAFNGTATATLENGQIVLTDHTCGTSQMDLALTYDPGTGPTTFDIPSISQSTEGGIVSADLTGFAEADFTETQAAQDSQIRVDGFPPSGVSEVQTLTVTGTASGGTYTLTYGGEETADIAWNADAATIQAALEALSTVNEGDITVSGDLNSNPTFTFADTLGDVSLLEIDYSSLTGVSDATFTETTKGVQGDWISRSSNTIDDVIYGVTLHLHDTTDSSGEQINLTRDIASVKEKVQDFVDAYNAAVVFIQENTGYNDTLKTAGVLMADYVVSSIRNQIRTPLIAQTNGFIEDIDTFLTPGQIGLELDREGLLNLDMNVFDEAIAEDYLGVLDLIGADKTGTSDSNTVEFYGASSNYTTAGTYDVEVTISAGSITSAKIKLDSESTYRDMTIGDNIITGNSTFDDDNGDPLYPENGLQLSVDLSQSGTFNVTVRVKQGFAGAVEDVLDRMLNATSGSLQIDQEHVDDMIEELKDKIEREEERLDKQEQRLIAKFARLEKQLALIQNQMAALEMV